MPTHTSTRYSRLAGPVITHLGAPSAIVGLLFGCEVILIKIWIPHRPIHIILFLLLAFLCYQAHQLTRHLVGAALCGGFGTMTFTAATTREPCAYPTVVLVSGPVLTYGLAYLGAFLLRSPRWALFAYALIFASFSHLRFIQNLTGRGDELILAQQWFGITNPLIVAACVFALGLPPVIAAFRVIANQHRWRVFIVSLLLPLPVLVVLLFGSAFLYEHSSLGTAFGSLVGIWLIVLVVDLGAAALFVVLLPRGLPTRRSEIITGS